MLKDITLGQYIPGNSVVHRLDPRTKILLMIAYIVAVFIVKRIEMFIPVILFTVLITVLAKVPANYMLKALKPMRLLLPLMFVMNLFLVKTGKTIVDWWIIHIYADGLTNAVFVVLRLATLVCGTSLLTLTTTPIALTDGLEKLLSPLKIIKFPAHELAMMMTVALRFIPTLIEEADKITSGNVFKRAKSMLPILIPLFVNSFRRADELAMAMESRCYHGGEGRTRMRVLKFHMGDLAAVIIFAAFITAVALAQRFLPAVKLF